MIQAIVFDFDGVLHNTIDLHIQSFNTLMSEGEFSHDEFVKLHDGNIHENTNLQHKLQYIDFSKYHETIAPAFEVQHMIAGTKRMLESYAKLYKLFIISSGGEQHQIPFLEYNGVLDCFTRVMGKETHPSKVEKFRMIFREYDLIAEDVVFVTDTLGDIREGHEVGVKTIAVDFGLHDRDRLLRGNPHAIISSFDELDQYIT